MEFSQDHDKTLKVRSANQYVVRIDQKTFSARASELLRALEGRRLEVVDSEGDLLVVISRYEESDLIGRGALAK